MILRRFLSRRTFLKGSGSTFIGGLFRRGGGGGAAGGVQSIIDITPHTAGFVQNIPSGAVGTFVPVLTSGPAASGGTMSVGGTNSGGFQPASVSGPSLALEQRVSGGTAAGTYTDTTLTYTNPAYTGSPFTLTPNPTLTGVVSGGAFIIAQSFRSTAQGQSGPFGLQGMWITVGSSNLSVT